MNYLLNQIKQVDIEIYKYLLLETLRQSNYINLIASENYASKFVRLIQASILTNKYAEGYPHHRYYHGCEWIDKIELLAIQRVKKLFKASYANVQPHSGTQANLAVFHALLSPGDKILSMNLSDGGHLSHGSKCNISGQLYKIKYYYLNHHQQIDYNNIQLIATKFKPKLIIAGFSAFSGKCCWKNLRTIADSIGAFLLIDIAHLAGLIAAKIYPNPVPYAHVVTSTTHKTLAGPRGGFILANEQFKQYYKQLDKAVFPGIQGGPLMHIIASKAIAFKEAMSKTFRTQQCQIVKNAKLMSKILLSRGIKIISGISQTHLFLIDVSKHNLTGKIVSNLLYKAHIIVNKNLIPNDHYSSYITSGIRLGTVSITKRGLSSLDCIRLAHWIANIIFYPNNSNLIKQIKKKILVLCNMYPIQANFNNI